MRAGGARSGLSALTGASSAFVPYNERYSSERLQPPEQPDKQCPSSQGMQPARVQRAKGSSNESMCEGDHCQPRGTSMCKQGCNGRAGDASHAKCNSQSGQHCTLGQQPVTQQPAPSSQASGVDVNIQEAQSAPPHSCPGPGRVPAPEAARSPQPAELSEEDTVISETPQRSAKRRQAKGALARSKRGPWKNPAPEVFRLATASGATGGEPRQEGERAQRAQRRAARLAELRARSHQAAQGSAADSLLRNDSSGLDGSRGAALGLASMLQVERSRLCSWRITEFTIQDNRLYLFRRRSALGIFGNWEDALDIGLCPVVR